MEPLQLNIEISGESSSYEILVGSDLLGNSGTWAKQCLDASARNVLIVSNETVFGLYGDTVQTSLRTAGFQVSSFLIGDGERYKSLRTAEKALTAFSEAKLTRTDAVVALGGGVVGDLTGFAASVYLRGIKFLQIPTTFLSMIDSSVGGKTGVNTSFGKNLVGAFHQPRGVLIDTQVLKTLHRREMNAGLWEAVKQGAIDSPDLLNETGRFLELRRQRKVDLAGPEIADLISKQIRFKARIVSGDERESSLRTDGQSRKILNFGHTLAHALEKVTNYRKLKHGEAVGYGILFAGELSKTLALCSEKDINLLYDVVHSVGTLPRLSNIDLDAVLAAFEQDKKKVSGSLQMILLRGIGKPVILAGDDIPGPTVRKVLKTLLQQWA